MSPHPSFSLTTLKCAKHQPMNEGLTFKRNFHQVVLPYLANSIRLANRLAPGKWGVTPYFPDGVRLNVGFCESFTASSEEIALVVDEATPLEIPLFEKHGIVLEAKRGGDFYPSVRGSRRVIISNNGKTKNLLELLEPAHRRLIETASKTQFNSGSRTGHQDWTVDAVVEQLALPLAQPS
jgi:hypothetical protein